MTIHAEAAAAMLADFGAPVVCRLATATRRTVGRLRTSSEQVPDGMGGVVTRPRTTLSVPAGTLGELAPDARVLYDGRAYLVRAQAPSDDGALDVFTVVREHVEAGA